MIKSNSRYISVILLVFMLSIPISSQESTEVPTVPSEIATEFVATDTPTEAAIVTEEAVITEALVLTESPTEPILTEAVTAEATIEISLTPLLTEETIYPTETPALILPQGTSLEKLINYNPNASEASIQAMVAALGATELERLPQIGVMRVSIPDSVANTGAAMLAMQSSTAAMAAGLTTIEDNGTGTIALFPNDPFFDDFQSHLLNADRKSSNHVQAAWDISLRDGAGVVVAVLDTGIDAGHPDFAGNVVAGWDFAYDDNNPDDVNAHGTHIAGIIAANTNNSIGIAGVAFNALVMPVKVMKNDFTGYAYDLAAGIVFATDRGARVINMSLQHYPAAASIQNAINYAVSRNVVVIAAAGNASSSVPSYPGAFDNVITVAALNYLGNIASFSNFNSTVDVAARGEDVFGTIPRQYNVGFGNGYTIMDGTSQATAHVSGIAALLIGDNIATTPVNVLEALTCGAWDLDDGIAGTGTEPGYDIYSGFGSVQADFALTWRDNSTACQISPVNDLIQNATPITSLPFSRTQAIDVRNVGTSTGDPTACGSPGQSLWYRFTPTVAGRYNLNSFGSSFNTTLSIYQGMPGTLSLVACNDDAGINNNSNLSVFLSAGVTYYIMLDPFDADVSGLAQLNVNPALTVTTVQQENAPALRYTGTWARLAQTGASGGYVFATTDGDALASFTMRGSFVEITRTIGPGRGNLEVWVDGLLKETIVNAGAFNQQRSYQVNLNSTGAGQWHEIVLRRAAGSVAPIDIDAIRVYDYSLPGTFVGASRLDEEAIQFFYGGSNWTTGNIAGNLNSDVAITSLASDYVEFRANASAITFYRATGTNTGTMSVYVDNFLYETVDNALLPNGASVPYSISNLVATEHIIRIVNTDGTLYFDGAKALVQAVLAAGLITDERSTAIAYTGIWSLSSNVLAQAGTVSTSTPTGRAEFLFSGNHLCIAYQEQPNGGNIQVFIDGTLHDEIDTTNAIVVNKREWCTYNEGINHLTDTLHRVRLLTVETVAGETVVLDYVRPVRRPILIASNGYVAESHSAFTYGGEWTTTTQASIGGASFQGGSARRADVDDLSVDTVSFAINGSGFVLYTSLPITANRSAWEIRVDGAIWQFDTGNAIELYLDLLNQQGRFRPVGFGVVNFGPGIHHIILKGIVTLPNLTNPAVDFDGIRVLP